MSEQRYVIRPEDQHQGWRVAQKALDGLRDATRTARDSEQPMEVVIRPYRSKRSQEQNRLQWFWLGEAEEQGDQTAEEYRAYCKLHLGVPILRAEDEHFRERYDQVVKGLPYETKLELMSEPFDFPVTRLMKTEQMTRYLEAMRRDLLQQGIALTSPEKAGIEW